MLAANSQEHSATPTKPEGETPEVVKKVTVQDIVNARRIIDGPSDKLRAVSATKYPWARPLWHKMKGNRWEVEQVSLVRDKIEFSKLSAEQQLAIRRALAFLSNLDSIQTENLALNISGIITDPSVSQLIARQQFEEWIHVEMYSAIVETLFKDPMEIYDLYRHTPVLSRKNDYIVAQGAEVTNDPTPENKVRAMVSNIALEGVYFFNGFLVFYDVNRSTGTMNGATDGIKYIQRDEVTHLEIFRNAFLSLRSERPKLFTKKLMTSCRDILANAAEMEGEWGKFVIGDGIPGLTHQIMEDYPKYLADLNAKAIGLEPIFNVKHPVEWVDSYANINGVQGNFFESKPLTYTENKPQFSSRRVRAAARAVSDNTLAEDTGTVPAK